MSDCIDEALRLARQASSVGEVPVGAVIVHNQTIIAATHNLVETRHDVSAHAELEALREAGRILGTRHLTDCDLYVTLEPCPMCAQAISFARIRRLYFGAYDPKGGGVEHGPRIFEQSSCHHKPEVIGGLREGECAALLKSFFAAKR